MELLSMYYCVSCMGDFLLVPSLYSRCIRKKLFEIRTAGVMAKAMVEISRPIVCHYSVAEPTEFTTDRLFLYLLNL